MWSVLICINIFLLTFISSVYGTPKNLWNIQNDTIGRYNLLYKDNLMIANACPEFKYSNTGTRINVCDANIYKLRDITYPVSYTDDILGNYTEYIYDYTPISNKKLPEVNCVFTLLETPMNSLLIRINLSKNIETNWISPMSNAQWSIQVDSKDTRILNVPPDNDVQSFWVSSEPTGLTQDTSNYVTAFYEHSKNKNPSNYHKGLIVGFLEHTIFKTGIEFTDQNINAIAGVNGLLLTRDRIPHGIVNISRSPLLFVHMNSDWRSGMEAYAEMIAKLSPQSESIQSLRGSPPIAGWNSWAMSAGHISQPTKQNLFAASDVLENLTSSFFGPTQYIVRDAIYNLNKNMTKEWITHVYSHSNQKTGSYSSPIILFKDVITEKNIYINCEMNTCSNSTQKDCYKVDDIILKDSEHNPITPINDIIINNKCILDVTHPAFICMLKNSTQKIKQNNMSFIKYDFLNYAAYEGNYYNKSIARTGMEAYTYMVTQIGNMWDKSVILDYGISIPFPVGPGMTLRRHTCDQMFGGIAYYMNAYTYGWWLSRLYMLNPDMIAFQENYWFKPGFKNITKIFSMDYKSRVAKSVVVGGFYANGDDLTNQSNVKVVQTYMGNKKVNTMWQQTKVGFPESVFRPITYAPHIQIPILKSIVPANIYIRQNGDIAVFNFGIFPKTYDINITKEISSFINKTIQCHDIWTTQTIPVVNNNSISIYLHKTTSTLIECRYKSMTNGSKSSRL